MNRRDADTPGRRGEVSPGLQGCRETAGPGGPETRRFLDRAPRRRGGPSPGRRVPMEGRERGDGASHRHRAEASRRRTDLATERPGGRPPCPDGDVASTGQGDPERKRPGALASWIAAARIRAAWRGQGAYSGRSGTGRQTGQGQGRAGGLSPGDLAEDDQYEGLGPRPNPRADAADHSSLGSSPPLLERSITSSES
jgi:hypothetical protein